MLHIPTRTDIESLTVGARLLKDIGSFRFYTVAIEEEEKCRNLKQRND